MARRIIYCPANSAWRKIFVSIFARVLRPMLYNFLIFYISIYYFIGGVAN